jgi:phosphoglycolate phosphatase
VKATFGNIDNMKKPAFVFDFDLTLADSSKGAVECINYALESMGKAPHPWNECCETIGLSLSETYKKLTGESAPEAMTTFHRLFVERADQVMASNTELYDGVREVVIRLASSGIVLGILSTKFRYRICQILDRYGITERFSAIIGGEDVLAQKPDPEGLRLLLSKTALKPDQVVLVGDSLTDAETAIRSGTEFVAVLSGTTSADQFTAYCPKAILKSVVEIEKFAELVT